MLLDSVVTSLVEVWIEITQGTQYTAESESLPLWKCGLKYFNRGTCFRAQLSLPLWKCGLKFVAYFGRNSCGSSLPLWKCGLKYMVHARIICINSHFPCGSVD